MLLCENCARHEEMWALLRAHTGEPEESDGQSRTGQQGEQLQMPLQVPPLPAQQEDTRD